MKNSELYLAVLVPATIIAAWLIGASRQQADLSGFLKQALPEASHFKALPDMVYAGFSSTEAGEELAGYVAFGEATGYGGPMRVAAAIGGKGDITAIVIIDHKESAAYFQKVKSKNFPACLVGKKCSDRFSIGDDVIAVTGATRTLGALADSVRRACRNVAAGQLSMVVPPDAKPTIKFGPPEFVLLLLYGAAFAGYRRNFKHKKILRWVLLLTGLVFLGFLYNIPVSLGNINSLLMGYLPSWRLYLYWYLLIGGVFLTILLAGRNPYCESFCPFGCVQDCLALAGPTKLQIKPPYFSYLRQVQRVLAWSVIVLALVYRNSSYYNYEVSGAFFSITGTKAQFALLALVLLASLFITRPWCNFLCPVRAVTDYLRLIRKGLQNLRKNVDPAQPVSSNTQK